jgi:hypothetical protein
MKITIEIDGKTTVRDFNNTEWNMFLASSDDISRTIREMLVEVGEYVKDESIDKYSTLRMRGVMYKRVLRDESKDEITWESDND